VAESVAGAVCPAANAASRNGAAAAKSFVLEQEESAFAAHCEVEISVSIKVGDSDLDAAPGAAAIIDHMLRPIDRMSSRIEYPLIPIHSQRLAFPGITPVMCHVALSGQQAQVSSLAEIHDRHRMRLRPAVINDMFDPFPIARVLEPEDAVSVCHRGDNIGPAIAVHIADVHKAQEFLEVPIRMKGPIALPRIAGSLQPASRSQDVVAAVSVYIANTNAMTVTVVADNVLNDSAVLISFVPGKRTIVSELRQNLVGLPVVVKVDQEGKLDG
jgi:hypothetical protein